MKNKTKGKIVLGAAAITGYALLVLVTASGVSSDYETSFYTALWQSALAVGAMLAVIFGAIAFIVWGLELLTKDD